MGNLLGNQHVGMLFINFEKPHRLRLQGLATVHDNDPLLPEYPEAQLIVRVTVTEIFRNCRAMCITIEKLSRRNLCRVPPVKRRSRHGSVSTISRRLCRREIESAWSAKVV